jgi:hypothetical protein
MRVAYGAVGPSALVVPARAKSTLPRGRPHSLMGRDTDSRSSPLDSSFPQQTVPAASQTVGGGV